MKTDTVLTMNKYFDACCGVPKHANPPADNARHIPITSEGVSPESEEHGCRCDRRGHVRLALKSGSRDSAPRPTILFCKQMR